MNTAVRVLLHLLVHVLSSDALVKGYAVKLSSSRLKSSAKQLKHKLQKFNEQEYFRDITEEVPTFFQRKNKNGKILNAFQQDSWFEIRTKHTGNIWLGLLTFSKQI